MNRRDSDPLAVILYLIIAVVMVFSCAIGAGLMYGYLNWL